MMAAVRCSVECLSEFSECQSHTARVIQHDTSLIITRGEDDDDADVFIFSVQEKRVTTVLQFEAPVRCLALSDDKKRLYALCENGGLYCTLLPQLSSSLLENRSPDPVLCSVSDDSIVLKNVTLQALIIAEKILVTLSLEKSVWRFDLYEETGVSEGPIAHKLASFHLTTVNTFSSHTSEDSINLTDKAKRVSLPPVLTCIYHYEDSSSSRAQKSPFHPCLEPHLFRLLFGVDASLVKSPVILCGLPDGRICCFPLLLPALAGPRGGQRAPIRVLQSLEQPIIFIGTSDSGTQGHQCLVAVGWRGKLLLVRSKQANSEGKEADYCFNEHTIRGPVVCACADDKHLYYSSLNDLLRVHLTKTTESTESYLPAQSSGSLGVCRVAALAGPYTSPTGSVQLLALSLSGRLLCVNLSQGSDNGNVSSSAQAGQRVKDLLASIGNIWERAESLKHSLQEKNECLKCLNQVMNICSLLLTNHGNEKDFKQPISCQGVARWTSMLQKDSMTLTCVLENGSGYVLEQGWTLCVQVQPLSHSRCPNMESSSWTYSFPVRKLNSGQKFDITIPLPIDRELFLPVKVFCSLAVSLPALFGSESSLHSLGVSQLLTGTGSLNIPLNTLTVDWLDALRLEGSLSHGNNARHGTAMDVSQAFLRSRGVLNQDTSTVNNSEPLAVVVRVSSELLKNKLHLSATSSAEICLSVLNWLVSKPGTTGQSSVQSTVVCAYSPDGHIVKLLAKEMTLGEFISDGPLAVLEVRVESMSMAAVCGLHHAILRRLQVLLRDTPVKCGHTEQLKAQSLNETIQQIECLYKDLQNAQNQAALGGAMKTNKSSETLLRIFLQLRAKPLVIL